jgi:hypothetical protein
MKYTVKSATPTGKVDPKFGTEYIVHFNEDIREVKLSRQKPVELGQEENGQIVDSKFGAYFKKDPFVRDVPLQDQKPAWKDNSDGQRQGNCLTNAANYVLAISPNPLKPLDWANAVHQYAEALYQTGGLQTALEELTAPVEATVGTTEAITPQDIQAIFPN